MVQYLRAHDWRMVEDLADALRQDWHISKRGGDDDILHGPLPVVDEPVDRAELNPHCDYHRQFEYDCIDCGDAALLGRGS